MQRGRKPFASTLVQSPITGIRSPLSSPITLNKEEQSIFDLVAAENDHLLPRDSPLVAAYSQAAAKTFKLARESDVQAWERATRIMAMLATKLRISPQATQDPQTIGRRRADAPKGPRPWETLE